jgi:hypothetical protein
MNEDQLSRLRNRLQRRKAQLEQAKGRFFPPALRRFYDFLITDTMLAPILDDLRENATGQKAASEAKYAGDHPVQGVYPPPQVTTDLIDSIAENKDYAAYAFNLLHGVVKEGWSLDAICLVMFSGDPSGMMQLDYSTFHRHVITPFCDYIDEKLDDQQVLLGLLTRYKHRCEWFNREDLLRIIEEEKAEKAAGKAKRAEVEDALKEDLYLFLHDQGINFTIEPYSHKGKIDLILDQKDTGRTYLEGKVFENEKPWDRAFIIKGFGQLLHYLRQYNAAHGYLLVYETCEEHLEIVGAEKLREIPFIRCDDGKVIFILVVDVFPYDKPVSQRDYKPVRITADELCKADQGNQG